VRIVLEYSLSGYRHVRLVDAAERANFSTILQYVVLVNSHYQFVHTQKKNQEATRDMYYVIVLRLSRGVCSLREKYVKSYCSIFYCYLAKFV
jgi:hypothetical protein